MAEFSTFSEKKHPQDNSRDEKQSEHEKKPEPAA